jgi:dolichol-phosphate mannosyltransferase
MKILVVTPTYNERENLPALFQGVLNVRPDIEMLVVDDHSPDGTSALVRTWAQTEPRVHLLEREKKMGLGSAYRDGFRWGLARDYDLFIEMDADLSHSPHYLPHFLKEITTCDVAVGSRWVQGGGIVRWPFYRVILSRCAGLYCKFILKVPVADMTAGYVCYRREVLEKIGLDTIHSDGYCFQIEMKYRVFRSGFVIHEIPILFTDRTAGRSKISRHIILEALFKVWQLRFFS